jgi:hypothetical protein
MRYSAFLTATTTIILLLASASVWGDIVELKDGTVLLNCYVRDEGVRLLVWENLDKVGTPDFRTIPRSQLAPRLSKRYTKVVDGEKKNLGNQNPLIDRGPEWDAKPQLPDLSVAFIEMNPKLAGLHGRIQYTKYNTPCPGGAPVIDKRAQELGEEKKFLEPEYLVQDLKLKYEPGEEITFTAHVKNFGFTTANSFRYRWLIDDKEVDTGSCRKRLKELEETTFEYKYNWQEGKHTVGFEIITDQEEIATINNKATDAMWAFSYFYIVAPGRTEAWHRSRSAYGNFSWEDFYRWHLDIMNLLFEASVYPSAPQGIVARVRLDKIYYLDKVTSETINGARIRDDGIGYDQGGWIWSNSDEQNETGKFEGPTHRWRNQTEWSLPHELGHQLGIVDYYAIDYAGSDDHVWPDNGEKVAHFQNHPATMMHWHGPQPFNELTAMYMNQTWNKPRGYFGDHYFAIPDENFLRIVDINGKGVPNAKVELFQRGTEVDPKGKPQTEQGVTWYPIVEDDNFGKPCSRKPVIAGATDKDGIIRLPNRPAFEVKTLNGYHRTASPWGNINVVGGRGLMLVKVTKGPYPPAYFYLEAIDYNLAYYTGHKESFTVTLETPFGSADSPKPPVGVRWEYVDNAKKKVRVTWRAPGVRERNYMETPIAYRVYRRNGPMGLNDRPWYPVATVNPEVFETVVDLDETMVRDVSWFSHTIRFAVSSIAQTGTESGLIQASDVNPKQ